MAATRFGIAVLLCGGVIAGCAGGEDGGGSDEAKVRAVVDELQTAAREGNGSRICEELFTENLRISIQRAAKRPCPDEVTDNIARDDASFDVLDLELNGDNANARLVDQRGEESDVLFQRDGERWRIARIADAGS